MRKPELEPNGGNATEEELKVAMEAAPNRRSYVRLCALRALLLGHKRQPNRLYTAFIDVIA